MFTDYPHHIPGFAYRGCWRYFLTFCCDQRKKAFSDEDAVALVWSQFLRAAEDCRFAIIACCLMPDHVHLLVEGLDDDSDLKELVSRAKQSSGYEYRQRFGKRLWQRYSYEHVLRDSEPTRAIVAYVLENPVRAKLVETVYDYPHFRSTLYGRRELIEFAFGSRGSE